MNTSIAAGAAIPKDDDEVLQALLAASTTSGSLSRPTGQLWQVGVRNEARVVYRTGTLRSRNQLRRLVLRLGRIGYVMEAEGGAGRPGGLDAVFSRQRGPGPASAQSAA